MNDLDFVGFLGREQWVDRLERLPHDVSGWCSAEPRTKGEVTALLAPIEYEVRQRRGP